jgi:hypothetical protein
MTDGSGLTNLVPTAMQGAEPQTLSYTSTNLVIPFNGYDVYNVTLTNDVTITASVTDTNRLSAVSLRVFWEAGASQTWDTNHWEFIGGSAPEITSNDYSYIEAVTRWGSDKATVGLLP